MCGAQLQALPLPVQHVARCLQDAHHPYLPVWLDEAAYLGPANTPAQQAHLLAQCGMAQPPALEAAGGHPGTVLHTTLWLRSTDGAPVLLITGGDMAVTAEGLQHALGKIAPAIPDAVWTHTGCPAGAISPLGFVAAPSAHMPPLTPCLPRTTVVDASLLQQPLLWATAGHPQAWFALSGAQLYALLTDATGAPPRVLNVAAAMAGHPAHHAAASSFFPSLTA